MTNFWHSELGDLSGTAESAFIKSFDLIPDGTLALAKIKEFKNDAFGSDKFYKIEWVLIEGDFKGQHVFQKIKTFDIKPTVKHTALNMMMLLFKMFGINPQSGNPPSDLELRAFCDKVAGIKIQETKPNDEGKQYNYISEVHPAAGFKSITGQRKIVSPVITRATGNGSLDSALSRGAAARNSSAPDDMEMDVPF